MNLLGADGNGNDRSEKERTPVGPGEWSEPQPAVIPPPTYWPMALAFAATIMSLGLVTSYFFTLIGLPLLVLSLYRWIEEMRR
jgi:hypothetical protein